MELKYLFKLRVNCQKQKHPEKRLDPFSLILMYTYIYIPNQPLSIKNMRAGKIFDKFTLQCDEKYNRPFDLLFQKTLEQLCSAAILKIYTYAQSHSFRKSQPLSQSARAVKNQSKSETIFSAVFVRKGCALYIKKNTYAAKATWRQQETNYRETKMHSGNIITTMHVARSISRKCIKQINEACVRIFASMCVCAMLPKKRL